MRPTGAPGVLALAAGATLAAAHSMGRPGHGLVGYGIDMYNPLCAKSCTDAFLPYVFCADVEPAAAGHGMGMSMMAAEDDGHDAAPLTEGRLTATTEPSAECLASNAPYLQTMAYCVSTHCAGVLSEERIETWWHLSLLGKQVHQPVPVTTYRETLASIPSPPTETASEDEPLRNAALVNQTTYATTYNTLSAFQDVEAAHSRAGLIILISGSALPIALSLTRFLPLPGRFVSRWRSFWIDAPLLARRLPLIGQPSVNRGQALFIAALIAINIIVSATGYRSAQPNSWFDSRNREMATYVANRTGVVSFAYVPLLILYAGRNSFLLWLTGWAHATFLRLHKCAALLCTLHACLHSAMYLRIYLGNGAAAHAAEARKGYWVWGIVATFVLCIALVGSFRFIRAAAYEVWLLVHILLAVFTLVGAWYHIMLRYGRQWGYETWLYIAFGVWVFDRLWRAVRLLWNGRAQAFVYRIDDNYLRIDVASTRHCAVLYAYFTTLSDSTTLVPRVWENHPFSVAAYLPHAPAIAPLPGHAVEEKEAADHDMSLTSRSSSSSRCEHDNPSEKESSRSSPGDISPAPPTTPATGAVSVLFVRVHTGLTKYLAQVAVPLGSHATPIPVYLEPYRDHSLAAPEDPAARVLCIAGGTGITAVLPTLAASAPGTARLFWGVRTAPLVASVRDLVEQGGLGPGGAPWGGLDVHVSVGQRLDLAQILTAELTARYPTTVIVAGPQGMIEDVRVLVARAAQRGAVVRLEVKSFTW